MNVQWASGLLLLIALYATLGLCFGLPFVWRGVGRIDPQAEQGSWGFRWMILPGVVALWPLLAWRWWHRRPPPTAWTAHQRGDKGGTAE
ncbi:MAG: hypothetical protein K8J08_22985 [Thermoanaerobaculia bacterium]|nr:hypothetical protein [Thermoanaerobaculia bacterium]